jgi:hypothetical protein
MEQITWKQLQNKQIRNGIILIVLAYIVGCLLFACWECGPAKKYFDDAACNFHRDILIATIGVLKVIFGLSACGSALLGLVYVCHALTCYDDLRDEVKKINKERKQFTHKQK